MGIRGVTSQFSKGLLVLVDGRSVYTPLFAGGEIAVSSHNLLQDEHIESDHAAGSPSVGIRRSVTASFTWRP